MLDLTKHPAYGGLDLAATRDLTSFVLAWPIEDLVYAHPWFWIPREGLAERCHRDNVPYDRWADDGLIELTPGPVTDWRYVTDRIKQISRVYDVREIAFDRAGARDTVADLNEHNLTTIDHGQGFLSMSAPSKRLEELVFSSKLRHNGHPILRWNIDCCTIDSDAAGNIKPVKPKRLMSSKRIDGVVALIMAISRAMLQTNNQPMVWSLG